MSNPKLDLPTIIKNRLLDGENAVCFSEKQLAMCIYSIDVIHFVDCCKIEKVNLSVVNHPRNKNAKTFNAELKKILDLSKLAGFASVNQFSKWIEETGVSICFAHFLYPVNIPRSTPWNQNYYNKDLSNKV